MISGPFAAIDDALLATMRRSKIGNRLPRGLGSAVSVFGNAFLLADVFGNTATAPRGQMLSTFNSKVLANVFAAGWARAVPVPGLNILAGVAGYMAGEAMQKPFQAFAEFGRNVRRLEMGGNYQDTAYAATMRQRAAQEMGTSLLNARQYLGKEAALMHQ